MSEQAYFLYDPETDTADLIESGKEPDKLRQYLASLATGVGDNDAVQDAMIRIVSEPNVNNIQINRARTLFHSDNYHRVQQGIIDAARKHQISSADTIQDLDLLDSCSESTTLINKNGVMLDCYLEIAGEPAADEGTDWYYSETDPKHEVVMQLLHSGIDELYHILQFEFDPITSSMYSDRYHEALGIMKNDEYVPVVTFLSKEHPVTQLVAENANA